MLSLHTSYGEYHTKVFYISLCLNGRERAFKHPYFLAKGAVQSNGEKPPLTTTTMQRYG